VGGGAAGGAGDGVGAADQAAIAGGFQSVADVFDRDCADAAVGEDCERVAETGWVDGAGPERVAGEPGASCAAGFVRDREGDGGAVDRAWDSERGGFVGDGSAACGAGVGVILRGELVGGVSWDR